MSAKRTAKAKASKTAAKKSGVAKKRSSSKKKKKKTASNAKKASKVMAAPKKRASKARVTAKKKTVKKKVAKTAPAKKAPKRSPKEQAALRRKRAQFRKLLLQKQQNLVQAYISGKGDSRMHTRDGTEDYIDYAVSSYARDFTLSLTELDRKQLKLVEEALERLRQRKYGHCMHCSQEIPVPRLAVEPWARYCIRCQELDDQGLLQSRFFAEDEEEEEASAASPDDEEELEEVEKEVVIDDTEADDSADDDSDEEESIGI